jgi:hypothetical protein
MEPHYLSDTPLVATSPLAGEVAAAGGGWGEPDSNGPGMRSVNAAPMSRK